MKKVFLGGTCNESQWRDKLIKILKIDYFNPVVKDWTDVCRQEEIKQRKMCDYCLYTITPLIQGVFSIAEVVDDSNKIPEKTILCILDRDEQIIIDEENSDITIADVVFSINMKKSLNAVIELVKRNNIKVFYSLEQVANYLNKIGDENE